MNRQVLLALIALAAAVAAVVAWRAVGAAPTLPEPFAEPPATSGEVPDAAARETDAAATDRERDAAPRRPASTLARWVRELLGDEPPDDPDAGLPTAAITGRLAWSETFLPVEGARVRLQRHSRDTVIPEPGEDLTPPDDDPTTTTRTDRYGKFVLERVPVRENLFLRFELEDGTAEIRDVRTLPDADAQTWQGEYLLEPRGTLVGRVVGPDGAPLAGVRLRAVDELRFDDPAVPGEIQEGRIAGAETMLLERADGRRTRNALDARQRLLPFPTATSKADGSFTIHGVREGDANLVLQHDELVGRRVQVPIVAGRTTDVGAIALMRATPFTVRVVDPERRPLAGVDVAVTPFGWKFGPPSRRTGADGQVTFRLNASDEDTLGLGVRISVRRRSAAPWTQCDVCEGPGCEIVLPDADELGVRVDVFGGSPADLAPGAVRFTTRPVIDDLRWSGSGGTYRIRGLPPETSVVLGAVAEGFAPGVTRVFGQPVRTRALDATEDDVAQERPLVISPQQLQRGIPGMTVLTLVPTFPVRVRVVDDAQQPLAGARVSVTPSQSLRWRDVPGTEWPLLIDGALLGVTGPDGVAVCEGLWDTAVTFTATYPHRGRLHLSKAALVRDELIVVQLPALSRVTGQIVESGAPVARRYRVRMEQPPPQDALQLHPRRDPVETVSNDSGAFELPQVGGGFWRLTVLEPRLPDAGLAFAPRLRPATYLSRALSLDPGTRVDLTLDLTSERSRSDVDGTVTLGGKPAANVRVELWDDGPRSRAAADGRLRTGAATTDARGRFAIPATGWRLRTPELRVLVPRRRTAMLVASRALDPKELRATRSDPIAIDVPVGDLELALRDADGFALANRPIRLVGETGARIGVVADRDGVVREPQLPAGRYEVVATGDDGARLAFEQVAVLAGQLTTSVQTAAR